MIIVSALSLRYKERLRQIEIDREKERYRELDNKNYWVEMLVSHILETLEN